MIARRRRRAADPDKERIAFLQASIPDLAAMVDAETAVNLVPRPSPVVGQVLRRLQPVVMPDVVSVSAVPAPLPIDKS